MKRVSFPLLFVAFAAFSVSSLTAKPQQDGVHAPSGGTQTVVTSISVRPLPGAPFTATVTTEWKHTLDDGGTFTTGNRRAIARDNSGRVFQERRNLYPAGDPRENEIDRLEFADPRAHTLTTCWPAAHACFVGPYFASAFDMPPVPAGPSQDGKFFLTRVDLGHDQVQGIEAIGTRETTTINVGAMGNDRAINIVKEFWYSPQLELNLIEKRNDPRYGAQTFTVSQISLGEPAASLFDIPSGYRVEDKRSGN